MLLKVQSASVSGIEAQIIDIEVDLSLRWGRKYHVVDLPDVQRLEKVESGSEPPSKTVVSSSPIWRSITVNLAPADFQKGGQLL